MPGVQPMPDPAELAIELERPRREQRDEGADRDRVDRRDVIRLEAEHERRDDEPQAAGEVDPFGAQVIAAEAEVRSSPSPATAASRPHFPACRLHLAPSGAFPWTMQFAGPFGRAV